MARISKQELISLQKKFKTDARIGEQYGITRQAIHQLRKKYGIESRLAGNADRNQEIASLRENGTKVEVIAKKFKLSIPQVYRIIKDTVIKKSKKNSKKR